MAVAASNYEGGNEQVRTSIMNAFGYFQTESSYHAPEYLPYVRKFQELVEESILKRQAQRSKGAWRTCTTPWRWTR